MRRLLKWMQEDDPALTFAVFVVLMLAFYHVALYALSWLYCFAGRTCQP